MLAGGLPFDRETPLATGAAILTEDPPELPAEVPLELDRIVRRCLEKDRKRRYDSAGGKFWHRAPAQMIVKHLRHACYIEGGNGYSGNPRPRPVGERRICRSAQRAD